MRIAKIKGRDCIRAAREALRIDPNLGEAYANIATAYDTMGKVDEAIAALREEVRINPNLRLATRNLSVELAIKARSGHTSPAPGCPRSPRWTLS